jgi:hypothetical protein
LTPVFDSFQKPTIKQVNETNVLKKINTIPREIKFAEKPTKIDSKIDDQSISNRSISVFPIANRIFYEKEIFSIKSKEEYRRIVNNIKNKFDYELNLSNNNYSDGSRSRVSRNNLRNINYNLWLITVIETTLNQNALEIHTNLANSYNKIRLHENSDLINALLMIYHILPPTILDYMPDKKDLMIGWTMLDVVTQANAKNLINNQIYNLGQICILDQDQIDNLEKILGKRKIQEFQTLFISGLLNHLLSVFEKFNKENLLNLTEIENLYGVGEKTLKKLKEGNIKTITELAMTSPETVTNSTKISLDRSRKLVVMARQTCLLMIWRVIL